MDSNKLLIDALHWLPNENKRILPPQEAKKVFHLLDTLDIFVTNELRILDQVKKEGKPVELNAFRKKVRDCWYANPNLIDGFIQSQTGQNLTEEEKQILIGWKHRNTETFVCIKYCAQYAVFKSMNNNDDNYYAVLALTDDFDQLLPYHKPPYMLNTALLPYKDVIIWDGLITTHGISFGKGIRESFNDEYQRIKKENRIISKLAISK